MKYIYVYDRYHSEQRREHEELSDAIDDAFDDHCSGEAWPDRIMDENKNIVMDREALFETFVERSRELYQDCNKI